MATGATSGFGTSSDGAASISEPLSWLGIARLGLVMMSLGAILVLTNSTINRVMVVELALPAFVPGLLISLYHAAQMLRPRWGHGSDVGARLTPWIIAGMAILALGGTGASLSTTVVPNHFWAGIALATVSFLLVGIGSGAAGTCLLVLLAKRTAPERRGPAATIVWLMMIFGLAVTSGVVGHMLEPYSHARLVQIAGLVAMTAVLVTTLAVMGIEGDSWRQGKAKSTEERPPFMVALRQVWAEPDSRRLTIFVFVSMLAFFSEELMLDPFSAFVFGYTPGQSTKLSSALKSGVFVGMLLLAIASGTSLRHRLPLTFLMRAGCLGSAAAMLALVACGLIGPPMPLAPIVFALGVANGVFSIAAIAWMMTLAGRGRKGSEGVRMGMWGAAQALAAGLGGLTGAIGSDIARALTTDTGQAYASVFALQAMVFVYAAWIAPASNVEAGDAASSPYSSVDAAASAAPTSVRLQPAE
jgi:BCD family chlorophyll transporter-like MFS transporter